MAFRVLTLFGTFEKPAPGFQYLISFHLEICYYYQMSLQLYFPKSFLTSMLQHSFIRLEPESECLGNKPIQFFGSLRRLEYNFELFFQFCLLHLFQCFAITLRNNKTCILSSRDCQKQRFYVLSHASTPQSHASLCMFRHL